MKNVNLFSSKLVASILTLFIFLSGVSKAEKVAIIDAGSSGSRLFVYDVDALNPNPVQLIYPISSEQQKKSKGRPLSSIANHTDSVNVFLRNITANYPCDSMRLYIFATAGMRLKPKAQADAIYEKLLKQPKVNGYVVKGAMTISGQYEGLYGWLAANYENGKIGMEKENGKTVMTYEGEPYGILEIGGASMQLAFSTHHAGRHCLYREGLGYIFCKSYLGAGVDQIYQHTEKGKTYKFDYDFGRDYSMWYAKTIFLGLGIPVNNVIKGVNGQTMKKSYKSKVKAYVKSLDDFEDSVENYHPRMNAHYIRWASHKLHLDGKLVQPDKDASWTVGAAIDIAVNKMNPIGYCHERPN